MPTKSTKRIIRLRQADSSGRQFIRVSQRKANYGIPDFSNFKIVITINPQFTKWLPLGEGWQELQQQFIPGAASLEDWQQMFNEAGNNNQEPQTTNAFTGVTGAQFAEFLFEHTIFEGLLPDA